MEAPSPALTSAGGVPHAGKRSLTGPGCRSSGWGLFVPGQGRTRRGVQVGGGGAGEDAGDREFACLGCCVGCVL
jgi:hypothetical protein